MAIYNPDEASSLEVSFAFERLYLRRDGASRITADVLVKNVGNQPIKRVRCVLPYALTDHPIKYAKTIAKAEQRLEALKQDQLRHIRLSNLEFLSPQGDSHWAYRLVRYVSIQNHDESGVFAVNRQGHLQGEPVRRGFIKRGWEIGLPLPAEKDIWLWFLYAANEIAVFDINAPEAKREWLRKDESMWLRFCIEVPPVMINRYSYVRQLFARQLEYLQIFMSADAVVEEVRRKLNSFHVPDKINAEIQDRMKAAKLAALDPIPLWAKNVKINDWRMFIHREFSHVINEPVQRTHSPWRPAIPQIYQLPFNADDSDCRRGPGPRWLHRAIFRGTRSDRCHEFWMGIEHDKAATGGYITEITSLTPNSIYNYITWAGLIGLTLSILNFMRTFLKLF